MTSSNSAAVRSGRAVAQVAGAGSVDGVLEEGLPAPVKKWRHPVTGNMHRLDGPAQVNPAYEAWYVDGVRHRVGGPAVITPEWQQWWHHGTLHRLDGPATMWTDGFRDWMVRGVSVVDDTAPGAAEERDELSRLYDSADSADHELLELVLSMWQPGCASVVELAQAVRDAAT